MVQSPIHKLNYIVITLQVVHTLETFGERRAILMYELLISGSGAFPATFI